MKPLYWTRIQLGNVPVFPGAVSSGPLIWDQVTDVEVSGQDLEDMFGKAERKAKAVKEEVTKKPDKVAKIIDGKKSQNLGIFLRSNKIDAELIKQILFECDTSLEVETLIQLQSLKASPEDELPLLQDHVRTKPDVPLDTPDQFLLELSRIHMLDERLSCLLFQSTFSTACEDISVRIDYVRSSSRFLMENKDLRNVLGVILGKIINVYSVFFLTFLILACGNYLNGGNKQRGQADGFAIDILPKLKDVKTKDNFSNLLSFIVK